MNGNLSFQADPGAIGEIQKRHELAFARARQECIALADRNAPRDLGRLAASITDDGPPRRGPSGIYGAFGSAERYALQREKGGEIRPVRKRALSWIDRKTGMRVVLGPGIRRTHLETDKLTGAPVLFVAKASVFQKATPYIQPAGDRFVDFIPDHLRALSGG